MPEYPWDIENMMLEQHKQPCDCAICDDIHMARLMRRKRREAMSENCQYAECKHCGQSVMESQIHSCKKMLLAEIEELKERVEKWKTWHDSASEDAKKWRRDAQELQGVVNEIRAELQSRAIHLLSKHCWCEPTGHPWVQKGAVAE